MDENRSFENIIYLVEKSQEGDQDALGELFSIFSEQIHDFIKNFKPALDVDSLTQDVFEKVVLHINQLKDPTKFKSWLYRIARNTMLKVARKAENSLPHVHILENLTRNTTDSTPIHHETPRQFAEYEEILEIVNRGEESSYGLLIYKINNYSNKEIAEKFNLEINSIKTMLHRARKKLREKLKILGYSPE